MRRTTAPDQAVRAITSSGTRGHPGLPRTSAVRWARENARTTREVISLEMWEQLNGFWHWLNSERAQRAFRRDRDDFYRRVKEAADLFQGLTDSTLLDAEPLDFMRLGMFLERSGQTARIMDVKHHMLGEGRSAVSDPDDPVEIAQWMALLHSCSASEAYLKRSRGVPTGEGIAAFLLHEPALPRSVLHGIEHALHHLGRIRASGHPDMGRRSERLLSDLAARLRNRPTDSSLHDELTVVVNATIAIGAALDEEYFGWTEPPSEGAAAVAGEA